MHGDTSNAPWSEGTLRPLSLVELALDVAMANTTTSASFVKLSSQNYFMFCSPTKSPVQPKLQKPKLTPARKLRFGSLGQATADTADTANDPHLNSDLTGDASSLTSPRADRPGESPAILARPIPYITQPAIDWHAHDDAVYGFTDPSFDYKAEISLIRNTSSAGYKVSTTSVEKGHHKKWLEFCGARGLQAMAAER